MNDTGSGDAHVSHAGDGTILYVGALPPLGGGGALLDAAVLSGLSARGYRLHALAPITPEVQALGTGTMHRLNFPISCFAVPDLVFDPSDPTARKNPDRLAPAMAGELQRLLDMLNPALILVGDENSVVGVAQGIGERCILFVLIAQGFVADILSHQFPQALGDTVLGAMQQAEQVITVAAHMAEGLRQRRFENVTAIPSCVDTTLFKPWPRSQGLRRRLGYRDDDLVVLHVSTLKPVKRAMDLVASAQSALPREPRLHYLVVGDGPFRHDMEKAVVTAGIAARFRFVGWVPQAEIPQYYRLANIVAMPSRREVLSLVCLEAQASGCALVASDNAGSRKLIDDGETGVIVPVGDIAALSEATLRLAGDTALCARIGRQARAHIVRHHDAKGWLSRYTDAIDRVLQNA